MFSYIFDLLHQPLYQLVFFLLLTMLSVPFLMAKKANATWNVTGILYVAFIFTNAVFFWFADGTWSYFFISLAVSVLYILAAGVVVSFLINALKISGSGESGMIFLVVIYHPVVLLLIVFVKWIIRSV